MKAVNLIPADQLRANGAAGKSGGGVYALLGGLALVVAMVAALTLTNRSVAEDVAKADQMEAQAQAAQAKAGNLASYKTFHQAVVQRTAGVQTLAGTRRAWGTTLEQVSRVVPTDVSLTKLVMSTTSAGGSSGAVALRSALANPAVELVGCAPSQARVALLMARLRRLEGVERVSVSSSSKSENQASTASDSASGGSGGCQTTDEVPQFGIVVFFGSDESAAAGTQGASGIQGAIKTLNEGTTGSTTTTPAP